MKGGFMKMKKSKWAIQAKIPVIIGMITIMICVTASAAFANTKTLVVPKQKQAGTYICWASCSSMAAAFFNVDTKDCQLDVLHFIKGPTADPDKPESMGTVADVVSGVYKYTNNHIQGSYLATEMSFFAIKNQIDKDGPVVAVYPYHAIIIKGYDDSNTSVTYNDPNDGVEHACTYQYLKDTLGYKNSAYWK